MRTKISPYTGQWRSTGGNRSNNYQNKGKSRRKIVLIAIIAIVIILLVVLGGLKASNGLIVIDPGHGGSDPGAMYGGVDEKDITLDVALMVTHELRSKGYNVIMTRDSDTYPELTDRAKLANNRNAAIFVSIHCNAEESLAIEGLETYYATGSDKGHDLAEKIHTRVLKKSDIKDRGVLKSNFSVLVNTACPAALIEIGFLSNSSERERLTDAHHQKNIAEGIARGIAEYLSANS